MIDILETEIVFLMIHGHQSYSEIMNMPVKRRKRLIERLNIMYLYKNY